MKSCTWMQIIFSDTNRKVKASSTFSIMWKTHPKYHFLTSVLRFFITLKGGLKFLFRFSYRSKLLPSSICEGIRLIFIDFMTAGPWQWRRNKKKSQLHRNWLMNNASIKNNQNLEFIVFTPILNVSDKV